MVGVKALLKVERMAKKTFVLMALQKVNSKVAGKAVLLAGTMVYGVVVTMVAMMVGELVERMAV